MIKETLRSTVGLLAGMNAVPTAIQSGDGVYRTEHDSIGDKKVPAEACPGR